VLRALSILCSTLAIRVAARFAGRRGDLAGVAAAALFACSPMLVLTGSEARGYAAALLVQAWLIDRFDPLHAAGDPPRALVMAAGLFGTLAHLLFLPALLMIAAWQVLAGQELRRTLVRLAPALAASLAVAALVLGGANLAQGGLTIGSSTPFSLSRWTTGVGEALRMSLGSAWLAIPLLLLLFVPPRPARADAMLWLTVGLGWPVAALLLRPLNVEFARYYLPCIVALLLLAAMRGTIRWVGWAVLAAILAAMAWQDARLIRAQRSEPDLPVRIIAAGQGSGLILSSSRLEAPVTLAAERIGMTLHTSSACSPAGYLLGDREWGQVARARVVFCGAEWALIATRPASYRDGAGWALYRRAGLHAPKATANGPRRAVPTAL
jgi:hypothetical protein